VGTASGRSPATPHRDSTLALVGTRPSEIRIYGYDEVILATGRQGSSRLSRLKSYRTLGYTTFAMSTPRHCSWRAVRSTWPRPAWFTLTPRSRYGCTRTSSATSSPMQQTSPPRDGGRQLAFC
jgi:hypothetical protein